MIDLCVECCRRCHFTLKKKKVFFFLVCFFCLLGYFGLFLFLLVVDFVVASKVGHSQEVPET